MEGLRRKQMNVLFLEAYHGGSHRAFAEGWRDRSRHDVRILSLPARKWKWRMQTAAWVFAEEVGRRPELQRPDAIVATDMVNLAEFLGLTRKWFADVPAYLYFHENQYSYPPQVEGKADYHWGTINSASALAADRLVFNSEFHRLDFFRCWRKGNRVMPDARIDDARIDDLEASSAVIPVGVNFEFLDRHEKSNDESEEKGEPEGEAFPARDDGPPLILWNHRWEHDKRPEVFFDALREVRRRGRPFRLAVCGESFAEKPGCFERAEREFAEEAVAFGYVKASADYARLLWSADVAVSTAAQEFLGLAVIEALWCGCYPLLPDRLNYPYLLPEEQRERHLYASDKDLANRLADLLKACENDSGGSSAGITYSPRQDFLSDYGWPSVASKMDDLVSG